jgi:hypothetical protein
LIKLELVSEDESADPKADQRADEVSDLIISLNAGDKEIEHRSRSAGSGRYYAQRIIAGRLHSIK